MDEKINILFNEIKLLKQNNKNSFDKKIKIMNNKIDNISIKINKKEDDIKNLINEKDIIIKDLKEKLLKQEKEHKIEIQKINNKIQEIISEKNKISENIKNVISDFELFKEKIKIRINEDIKSKNVKINNELTNLISTTKDLQNNFKIIKIDIDQLKNKEKKENSNNTQIFYSNDQMIFQSEEFNSLNQDEFKKKYYLNSKLLNLKEIHTEMIMGFKLSFRELDSRGNKFVGWSMNQKRGNYDYDPPIGWIGIGLKVLQKFDNSDNTWIGNNNSEGEWAVAYHGIGCGQSSENVKNIIRIILRSGFRAGHYQIHQDCEDINHKGCKVGKGVAFSPYIREAEDYSGILNINGIEYKAVIMVRIKPSAIRTCNCSSKFFIVNGTTNEVRPYRILFKRC